MIVEMKNLSKEDLIDINKKAIAQISKLVEEKQVLEDAIKKACFENNIQYVRGLVK